MIDLQKTHVTAQNYKKILQDLLIVYAGSVISLDNAKHRDIIIPGKIQSEEGQVKLCAGQIFMLIDKVIQMERGAAVAEYKEKIDALIEKNAINPENPLIKT